MKPTLVATIVCPSCHRELELAQDVCPRCGNRIANAATTSTDDVFRVIERPWVLTILLLHVGLLGIPIYLKTGYSLRTRLLICAISIAYTIVAVAIIVGVGSWLYREFVG